MLNKKRILPSDIRHACGDTYFSRGQKYFQQGHVLELSISLEDSTSVDLSSSILGSGKKYYTQTIRIDWKNEYTAVIIEGDCTCPMVYNCKHIAAACLEYINTSSQPLQDKADDYSCMEWLDNFDESEDHIDLSREFIAYILKPTKTAYTFTLDFIITRENKKGGFNKGRKTSINNLRYSGSYTSYIQPIDVELISLLSSLQITYQGEPQIKGSSGFLALTKILKVKRLFWLTHQSPSLHPGDERVLDFLWDQQNNNFHLSSNIKPNASLILTDPPLYIDSQENTLGSLQALEVSSIQLEKILSIPAIPENLVEEFSLRLTLEYPSIPLPAPKNIQVTELSGISLIPKITLSGTWTNSTNYYHFIKLNFVYDEKIISAYEPADYSHVNTPQGIFRIQRDAEAEDATVGFLIGLGFETAEILEEKQLTLFSPAHPSFMDSATRWSDFIEVTLPQLTDQGWVIEIDDSFKLNFHDAEDWHTDIEETNNDWFEMNFQIKINGESMSLLPLIMPVLEQYTPEEIPENLSIQIGEHSYVNMPSSQLKPFLNIVYELFDSSSISDQGVLKFSRFNTAALADLESQSYGIFSISGGKELIETGKKLKNFKGIASIPVPKGLKTTLREYQQLGLNWLQFLREYNFAGILADDMGLGKTVQALCHLLVEKEAGRMDKPCLVIAPTSLMSNWRREAERFTPDLTVLTLQGSERKQHFDKIKNHDLILTTYPLLPRDKETLLSVDYHFLILDEAQVIKNPRSQAALTVREIKTRHRLCLTGTPMENHLGELWAQFDFLMPGFLGNSAFFKKTYRTPIEIHNDQEQRERLSKRLQPFMLRRSKSEVATELPEKTVIIRSVPLYEKQAALYETIRITMEKKVRDAIADKGLARSHITILDALLKLRQTCCDPRTLTLKEAQKVNQSAKLDLLMEMLPELLEEGHRILVFSQFTRMIALIEKELNILKIGYSKLTGQTKKRDEAIESFKNGENDVFLISLKAGGVGLNLTEADTVIIYDPWWNPAVETQAADRAHRIGQDKPVFVYKLLTENTVEEKILAMQQKKRALADSIYNSGKKEKSSQLTSEDLTELFKPLS